MTGLAPLGHPAGASRLPTGPAWLFCPADRPDRWHKALERADVVIVDLEDAVAAENKDSARRAIREAGAPLERIVLRINAAGTRDHELDRALLREIPYRTVMLPKAEDPAAIRALSDQLVVPLIESPRGIERVGELVRPPNVIGAMWGADDLVAAMGGTGSRHVEGGFRDVARYARSRTLIAAKAHGLLALDAVHTDIVDVAGLQAECEDAAAVGFDATVAIHPSQVPVIRQAYRPSAEQVRWASALINAAADNHGVRTFEGRMVDGPVLLQAQQILRRHSQSAPVAGTP
ncbi:CoA ester lyase [Amycolatopsis acidicola]|uniref:CoA ester lyase n=1 Tax=Amycolatopsis acidicola TaxID=2596893 RepID=A0A5N0VGW7_9PSEU|nr:CoA ester lyase [Amycolatopsis acidicola]KAA9164390.1 CoA ester lyase [Amycolatopsis acidicola]